MCSERLPDACLLKRVFYTTLLILAAPAIIVYLFWRSVRQPAYREHWGERWGVMFPAVPAGPLIWVHAVSVGETRAAEPLLAALRERWPAAQLLVTHMTPTGRDTALALTQVTRCYLPYDYPWAMTRFLKHYRPSVGILVETEVWPNMVASANRLQVPLALVNARLSQRSLDKAGRYRELVRAALRGLELIVAQTTQDAQRLYALSGRSVAVAGNLKFDMSPRPASLELGQLWRKRIGARPVLLAASTREGEESLILEALRATPILPAGALLVLVPRHPQRFDEVAQLIERQGLPMQRRSSLGDAPVAASTRVLLGDSLGEMQAWYTLADVAFIGGSLLPLGGQNLIEACLCGCPVLLGPHTFNFAQASEDALNAGAALRLRDAPDLLVQAADLLTDVSRRAAMADAGLQFAGRHSGATARTLTALQAVVKLSEPI